MCQLLFSLFSKQPFRVIAGDFSEQISSDRSSHNRASVTAVFISHTVSGISVIFEHISKSHLYLTGSQWS
jgi:hypothetical protein